MTTSPSEAGIEHAVRNAAIRPVVRCQKCGAEWMLRKRGTTLPRQCWHCGVRTWNQPRKGMARQRPKSRVNQCLRCGWSWLPLQPEVRSVRCPRCYSVYWDRERPNG